MLRYVCMRGLVQGGSLKKTSMSELNWDHIVTEPEHLLELKAYCCEECGYTLFPARGRIREMACSILSGSRN